MKTVILGPLRSKGDVISPSNVPGISQPHNPRIVRPLILLPVKVPYCVPCPPETNLQINPKLIYFTAVAQAQLRFQDGKEF